MQERAAYQQQLNAHRQAPLETAASSPAAQVLPHAFASRCHVHVSHVIWYHQPVSFAAAIALIEAELRTRIAESLYPLQK